MKQKQAKLFVIKNCISGRAYYAVANMGLEFYSEMSLGKLRSNLFIVNSPLQADFRFYGEDYFTVEVLFTGSRSEAVNEKKLCLLHNKSYNLFADNPIDSKLRCEHASTTIALCRQSIDRYRIELVSLMDDDAKEEIETEIRELVSKIRSYEDVIDKEGRLL